jgi:hypothetical protein
MQYYYYNKPLNNRGLWKFMRVLFTALALVGVLSSVTNAQKLDSEMKKMFGFKPDELKRVEKLMADGVLEIATVVQAEAGSPDRKHMGWSVATQLPGGRIIVVFKQTKGHGTEGGDAGRHAVYTDDLKTWHPAKFPGDTSQFCPDSEGMHCLGWRITPGGVFR